MDSETRSLKEYHSRDLFKVDLQTNLRVYVNHDLWLKIKPNHPLPWDYSDMVLSYHKYFELSPVRGSFR